MITTPLTTLDEIQIIVIAGKVVVKSFFVKYKYFKVR